MQEIKLPTVDVGSESEASRVIPNRSPIFNKETNTLYMKYKENLIPIGSDVSYTKGIDALYFRGKFKDITNWPNYDYSSVIYLVSDCVIDDEIRAAGFWVNIGKYGPEWKPFCGSTGDTTPTYYSIGTIFIYGGTSIPDGYLECDGSEVSQSEYSDLFAQVQYSFGTPEKEGYFKLPLIEDKYFSYIIKSERTKTDKNIGIISMFAGKEIPTGYIDVEDQVFNSLENFELSLVLSERFGSTDDGRVVLPIVLNGHTKYIAKSKNAKYVPTGIISIVAKGCIQEGFAKCDGALVPKVNYAELYDIIGDNFGENSISFGLPNVQTDYFDFSIKTGKVEANTL